MNRIDSKYKSMAASALYYQLQLRNVGTLEIIKQFIRCVRPGFGLHPRHYNEVLGKHALRDLEFGIRLRLEDLD